MKISFLDYKNQKKQILIERLFLLGVLFGGIAAVSSCASSPSNYVDQREKSAHFNGKSFQNPNPNNKTLFSFLKMRLETPYSDWPQWRESQYRQAASERVKGNELHIMHINHSTVLIQLGGINILTDPIFSERCSPLSWIGPKRVRNPGIRFKDLPPIDYVLISHDHYDHLDIPTIKKLVQRDDPHIFVGLGVGKIFPQSSRVTEMDWWEDYTLDKSVEEHSKTKLTFVPVQHFSGRGLFDRNSTLWGGFVIEHRDKNIYFGGDTGYGYHFKDTYQKFGDMFLAILPIGAYAPRDFMSYAHIDPYEAIQAHKDLRAKVSLGVHYGTFQLTAEEVDAPIQELKKAMNQNGLDEKEFITPLFGEIIKLQM